MSTINIIVIVYCIYVILFIIIAIIIIIINYLSFLQCFLLFGADIYNISSCLVPIFILTHNMSGVNECLVST